MPEVKSGSKKDAKKQKLFIAAATVFSQKGYNNTSIKDITDEAGVSVGSFYSYFENKEDVVGELYDAMADTSREAASRVTKKTGSSVAQNFTRALTCALSVYTENKELSRIIILKCTGINDTLERKRWEILDKTNKFMRGVLAHLKSKHLIAIDNVGVIAVTITQSISGVIAYWLDGKLKNDLPEIIYSLCVYHLRALRIDFKDKEVKGCINEMLSMSRDEFQIGMVKD